MIETRASKSLKCFLENMVLGEWLIKKFDTRLTDNVQNLRRDKKVPKKEYVVCDFDSNNTFTFIVHTYFCCKLLKSDSSIESIELSTSSTFISQHNEINLQYLLSLSSAG